MDAANRGLSLLGEGRRIWHDNGMDETPPEDVAPPREKFTLEQFLKREGWTGTGGQAKYVIQEGMVRLNGIVETRRRKQLALGDVIEFETFRATVTEL